MSSSTIARRRLARALYTSAPCRDKPVMNRHSRIVTQPKDQGASQVRPQL